MNMRRTLIVFSLLLLMAQPAWAVTQYRTNYRESASVDWNTAKYGQMALWYHFHSSTSNIVYIDSIRIKGSDRKVAQLSSRRTGK